MQIIDKSQEIDIDLGISPENQVNEEPEKKNNFSSNSLLQEVIEEEIGQQEFDPKAEEKAFYENLSEIEKKAWDSGWRTGKFFKGKYKDGSPRPHKTAEEFLAIQERETPVLNERNRKLAAEKTSLEKQLEEMQKQMNVLLNVQKIAYEEKTQNRFQSLEEAEEAAILEGDVTKVRAIQKQRQELERNKVVFEEPKQENQIQPEDKAIFDEWAPDNTWFYENAPMRSYAESYFAKLPERLPLKERLEMVTEEIHATFASKLGIAKTPKVDSGVRGIQSAKKQYTYNDLPADVRRNCEFLAKSHKFSKEQIAKMQQEAIKEYFN